MPNVDATRAAGSGLPSSRHRGWYLDASVSASPRLVAVFNGTEIFDFDANDMAVAQATAFAANVTLSSTLTAGADGVGANGEQLTSGGAGTETSWTAAACLREVKNIGAERTDAEDVLAQMVSTPVYDFTYKEKVISTGDTKTQYTGIMAEDAPWATHYNGRILNPINTFGYTVLAMKALMHRIEELEKQLENSH